MYSAAICVPRKTIQYYVQRFVLVPLFQTYHINNSILLVQPVHTYVRLALKQRN